MAEKSRKPRPKKPAAVADVTPPPVKVTAPPFPDPLPPPPSGRQFEWGGIPWGEIEVAYLSPTISADGATAKWPTQIELASRFGVPLQTIREKAAEGKWRDRQKAIESAWWADRGLEINRELGHLFSSVRRQAFVGAARAVTRAAAILESKEVDSATGVRATVMLKNGYDAAARAVGIETPSEAARFGVTVNLAGTDKAEPGTGSLWQVLIQARRDAVPAVDAFDLPSPLPPSLASTR
jgi:hypothetical protein